MLSGVAGLVCLAVFVVFSFRTELRESGPASTRPSAEMLLLMLALGSLVMSQFGARAHINHSFTAMVLLVPLAAASMNTLKLWTAMNVLLGLSHLAVFALGNAALLPPESVLSRYTAAASLVQKVTALPAYLSPDALITFQQWMIDLMDRLPGETLVSLLSPLVFLLACLLVRSVFQAAAQPKLGMIAPEPPPI